MAYSQLRPRHTKDAYVEEISGKVSHYRLSIPSGKADRYRLAQIDDYTHLNRKDFPIRSSHSLSLFARASSEHIPGTWGFGLWNDPFGLSLGFGGNPFHLPALPNALWFFGASKESHLSFREAGDANGFLVQTFRSPKFHARLIPAGLALPFSRKVARRQLGKVIVDEGIRVSVDVAQWHKYRLDWREKQVSFEVDDALVFESSVSPYPPLGTVIWIDNQFAAFTPEGRISFGVLENPEPAWLEVKEIELK